MAQIESKDLILITGVPRSGITMISTVVHLCGACGVGSTEKVSRSRGLEKNDAVHRELVRPLLIGLGVDPRGQRIFPDVARCAEVAASVESSWRRWFETLVDGHYRDGPVFYASSFSCLLWPVWSRVFPSAKWLIVRRGEDALVNSCLHTGYMKQCATRSEWRSWVEEYKKRFVDIRQRFAVVETWPEFMIKGDMRDIKKAINDVGLPWSEEKVRDYLSPILWKSGVFEITY